MILDASPTARLSGTIASPEPLSELDVVAVWVADLRPRIRLPDPWTPDDCQHPWSSEAYMLLSIIGELRVGTSPRPVMATRLIVPERLARGRLER